jgi:ABC-type dipeptide/oligopeptide/nickel transport system permease component
MRLAPGDPAMMALPDYATDVQIALMRTKLGLDKPYITQYAIYIGNVLRGDFGVSVLYDRPCLDVIMDRLPATVSTAVVCSALVLFISIPLGIIAGVNKGGFIDFFAVLFALLGQSMSVVWICVLLLLLFSVRRNWLPSMGYNGLKDIKYLIMPAIAMGYKMCAGMVRMGRSGMIDVLDEDYITCAYARGLSPFVVNCKYAFKNAVIPVVTIFGLEVATMLAGAVIIETTFTIPGIGSMLVKAVSNRDYPLTQSTLVITAAIFAIVNLVVDIINTLIDSRLKLN